MNQSPTGVYPLTSALFAVPGTSLLILRRIEPLRLIPVLVFVALASFCLIIFNGNGALLQWAPAKH